MLQQHPLIQTAVCFAVPSKIYGEAVGAALIISPNAPAKTTLGEVTNELRTFMRLQKFENYKFPMKWIIVEEDDLPKTKTRKFIRVGLAEKLGLDKEEEAQVAAVEVVKKEENKKTAVDYEVLSGFRFSFPVSSCSCTLAPAKVGVLCATSVDSLGMCTPSSSLLDTF